MVTGNKMQGAGLASDLEVADELRREEAADREEDRFLTERRDTNTIDTLFGVIVAVVVALCFLGVLLHLFM